MRVKTTDQFLRTYNYIPPEQVVSRSVLSITDKAITVNIVFSYENQIFTETLVLPAGEPHTIDDAVVIYFTLGIRPRLNERPSYPPNGEINKLPLQEFIKRVPGEWVRAHNTPKY